MKNDYTDGLAFKAINLAFKYLSTTYKSNEKLREEIHNTSTNVGMTFMDAFLGINHVLAHISRDQNFTFHIDILT